MKPDADRALFRLGADATLADLKRAYRRAALTLHPDQNSDPAAAARFRELTDAFRRLESCLPPPAPKKRSLQDRAAWFAAEARSLMERWSEDRWSVPVDGLPASVWLASALEVLATLWHPPGPLPEGTGREGMARQLDRWSVWLEQHPLPARLPRGAASALAEALDAAEKRLRALTRPRRGTS